MSLIGETTAKLPPDLIKEGSDATFMADVVEASKIQPVIVDFWATWCGPCKTLTPMIEKAVKAAKGAVKLVKIDIDRNPVFAGQLRVQSIPTVYAFADGRPVDGFMGAVPESQLKAFIDKLAGPQLSEADELLAIAKESLEAGDIGAAAQAYAQLLQLEPGHLAAIGGLARCYLTGGDAERAREVADMAPPGAHNPDLDSVRAALALAAAAPSETRDAERRLAADPEDHEARLELARALAGKGQLQAATDHLLAILEKDRTWRDGAAKAELLTIFEAAGPVSEVTKLGRRKMAAILFS
jgi:putative thioredoxin